MKFPLFVLESYFVSEGSELRFKRGDLDIVKIQRNRDTRVDRDE